MQEHKGLPAERVPGPEKSVKVALETLDAGSNRMQWAAPGRNSAMARSKRCILKRFTQELGVSTREAVQRAIANQLPINLP